MNQTSIGFSTPDRNINNLQSILPGTSHNKTTSHYPNPPPNPSPLDNHHTCFPTSLPYANNHDQVIHQSSNPLSNNVIDPQFISQNNAQYPTSDIPPITTYNPKALPSSSTFQLS